MNRFVPDWNNNMGDISRPLGEEDDLIELLWCNGHVVMQSQSNRKLPPRPEKPPPPAAAPAPVAPHDDEAGLWFPYALADSLDRDIFSDFFCDAPEVADAGKACRGVPVGEDGGGGARAAAVSEAPCELMPPPKATSCSRQQKTMSLADGGGGDLSELAGTAADAGGASSSSMVSAMGSSICGSNQVLVPRAPPPADTARRSGGSPAPSAVGSANRNAIGGEASSSGRYSTGCFTTTTATTEPTTSASNRSSGKRKLLDTEDSESPTSEDAESESLMARRPPQKLTTARRSRAAEVHNLSERRRRDRINEKMRALQELIPHCNKADKASMLDEAIEYLKSLQMQVQMMWMAGGGMAAAAAPPVMFPGVHQYLPRMGMPMPPAVPRMPPFMAAAAAAAQPRAAVVPGAPVGLAAAEPFAHFLGVNPHMQPATPQGVSYYPTMGMKPAVQQQDPTLHVSDGVVPPESAPNRGPG